MTNENEGIKFGVISREQARQLSGIELFEGIIRGDFPAPPIAEGFNYSLAEIAPGRAVFCGVPTAKHYNPSGVVHGGYIATLLDSAMACAVHAGLPAGKGCTSLEFKINFVRPILENTGKISAEGLSITVGKQIATAEGKLTDSNGKLLAFGTTTLMILDV